MQPLEAYGNCILSNNAKNCTFNSLKGPCETCTNFPSEESPCVSAKIIHVSSDQAAAQRRAHAELSGKATQDLNDSSYKHYAFGLFHFPKNCISSLRHRLTDMFSTFYVGWLTPVWASNNAEAKHMKKAAPATVFSFKDVHSDEIGYKTVCKPLEDIVENMHGIVATLIPEQYKPTAVEAKNNTISQSHISLVMAMGISAILQSISRSYAKFRLPKISTSKTYCYPQQNKFY